MAKVIYSCEEHIDKAIDDLISYEETFPSLEKSKENNNCTYCDRKSIYLVK